jgi:hemoglobin
MSNVPTLAEWVGDPKRFDQWFTRFYERVRDDAVLAPIFANMDPAHAQHVAAFVREVFGGAKQYSGAHGGHPQMVRKHLARALTDAQRKRWLSLLLDTADEVGLPDDPEFRSALVGYLEWGSRLAVINSQPDAQVDAEAPMPAWNWGATGGPYVPKG